MLRLRDGIGVSTLIVSFVDPGAKQLFVDVFSPEHGIPQNSVQVADYGEYVVVENVSDDIASLIRNEPGVEAVLEDIQFEPFSLTDQK